MMVAYLGGQMAVLMVAPMVEVSVAELVPQSAATTVEPMAACWENLMADLKVVQKVEWMVGQLEY